MAYVTARPPSTYVPPDIKREFRKLLDNIHACDERNATHTPSSTLLLILATARRLGVSPADLVNEGDD
jgi:hypothetical protein